LHWRLSRYTLLTVSFDELWRDHRVVEVHGVGLRTLGAADGCCTSRDGPTAASIATNGRSTSFGVCARPTSR